MNNTLDDTFSLTDAWLNSSYDHPTTGTAMTQYSDLHSSLPLLEDPSLLGENKDMWSFFDTYPSTSLDIPTSSYYPYASDKLQSVSETYPSTYFSPSSIQTIGSDTKTTWLEPSYASSSTFSSPTITSSNFPSPTFEKAATNVDPHVNQQPLPPQETLRIPSDNSSSPSRDGSSRSQKTSNRTNEASKNIKVNGSSNAAEPINGKVVKVPRKRGRKRSNISLEERRSLRLERGRKAADKCRRKRRGMEIELENKAHELVIERDMMQQISDGLLEDVQMLREELLKHMEPPGDGTVPACNHIQRVES